MENIYRRFERLGLFLPEILLPAAGVDIGKWAVIACDQFTQDRGYWGKVKNAADGAPSTLNLIFPEVFLEDEDKDARISGIHRAMERYLADGVFSRAGRGCVYIERNTPFNRGRRGLVMAVDLEHYDWRPEARRLIRCTEGTVAERLPPRMDIRRSAALETSHVLLLVDDDEDRLFSALAKRAKERKPAYRSGLMLESGDVSGWLFDSEDDWKFIAAEFEELSRRALTRYDSGGEPFLFAAGDGNHSLATAKEIWEEYKKNHGAEENPDGSFVDGLPDHPCRYALVEIENIYDPAVRFEPIHRILFGIDFDDTMALLSELPGFSSRIVQERRELVRLVNEPVAGKNRLGLIAAGKGADSNVNGDVAAGRYALIETNAPGIATAGLQPLLDRWVKSASQLAGNSGAARPSIDYIHGEDELFRLAAGQTAAGILLPPVRKSGLFETVARSGPLPRKSFSMGEAVEKRFYLECRKLFSASSGG